MILTYDGVNKMSIPKKYQAVLDSMTTKSSRIRYLNEKGYTRAQIAHILNIRYQHVRNVLITPLKKGG